MQHIYFYGKSPHNGGTPANCGEGWGMGKLVAVEALNPKHDLLTRLLWFTGLRCNLNCSYCDHHDRTSPFLDLDMVKKAAENLQKSFVGRRLELVLTGGEPALHPDFLEMLRIFKEEGGIHYLGTMTNGMRPLEFFVQAMKWLDILIISYQVENPQRQKVLDVIEGLHHEMKQKKSAASRWLHVQIMVLPGELAHVREVTERLRGLEIPYTLRRIRPLLKKSTLSGAPEFVRPYEDPLSADGIQDPDLVFDENFPVSYYSKEELQTLKEWDEEWGSVGSFKQVESVYEVTKDGVQTFERRAQNVNDFLMRKENNFKGWQCWAGNQSIYIDEKGDLFAGSCKVKKMGNVATGFSIETKPLICTHGWCRCGTDLKVTRFDPKYKDQVRLQG